ncbi:MAG: cytochrome P450 [Solirubrobacterales bacterium]|nr:cytochrome P450 [Solirubrobacterales bacterium]
MAAVAEPPAPPAPPPPASALPPGPSIDPRRQVLAWVFRPEWLMERGREECGDVFTMHLPIGTIVSVADPAAIKQVFTGDPDVLRAGEGNKPLEPVLGPESLLLLDGPRHLKRRRLVLPPFHGDRLEVYARDMAALTEQDLATWPAGTPFALEPRMREITLAVIVRVVFGIEDDARAALLRRLIPQLLPDGGLSTLVLLPAFRRDLGPRSPWRRFLAARAAVDRVLFEEIAERRTRADLAERTDVLSLLVQARDEEGEPLTDRELRDELMTLLLAGHETTATALAWTFELLHRRPDAKARAVAEARGGTETAYLDAVGAEALRLKPPIPMVARRLTAPFEVAGHVLPAGARLGPNILLTHRRLDLYPDPYAFRPERFLGKGPETYSFLPFGGGIRRCVGAAFAQLELRTVLRTVLAGADLEPASERPERTRRRAVVLTPAGGARSVLVRRA